MDDTSPSSDQDYTDSSQVTKLGKAHESRSSQNPFQRSLGSSTKEAILESFGLEPKSFECRDCRRTRRFYDLLDSGKLVCIECSTKNGYALDPHAALNKRDPHLLANDPELIEIKNELVRWELEKGFVEVTIKLPRDLHDRLSKILEHEKSTLDILAASALALLANSYTKE